MKEIKAIYGENYEKDYGLTDYKGKTVLDVGADYGSTAWFFLQKGAAKVIAVEGSPKLFQRLLTNVDADVRVTPILLYIQTPEPLEMLLETFKPDITKIDCEGCEIHLTQVKNEALRLCPHFIIETHDTYEGCKKPTYQPKALERLTQKFKEAGFRLISCNRPSMQSIVVKHKDMPRICYWGL